jgi:hypothetical protein
LRTLPRASNFGTAPAVVSSEHIVDPHGRGIKRPPPENEGVGYPPHHGVNGDSSISKRPRSDAAAVEGVVAPNSNATYSNGTDTSTTPTSEPPTDPHPKEIILTPAPWSGSGSGPAFTFGSSSGMETLGEEAEDE